MFHGLVNKITAVDHSLYIPPFICYILVKARSYFPKRTTPLWTLQFLFLSKLWPFTYARLWLPRYLGDLWATRLQFGYFDGHSAADRRYATHGAGSARISNRSLRARATREATQPLARLRLRTVACFWMNQNVGHVCHR
jgi:hypothetical protein